MTDAFKRTPGWTSSCQGTREEVHLRPRGTAPRIVRHLVHTVCDEAGLSHRLKDDAAMVASELVLASIRQARCDIDVSVEADANHVRIGVHDTWPTPPLLGRDQRTSPARSTTVVERLASSWGYYSGEDGRELWALLRLKRVR